MENNTAYHIPVLAQAAVDGLNIQPTGCYVDVTFGGGGHARAIYNKLSPEGLLIAFDQDEDAAKNTWKSANFHFIKSNFSFLQNQLRLLNIKNIDGLLADLGVSSHQFDAGQRGFSIRTHAMLDMRMNQKSELTAKKVVNEYSEEALTLIFRTYADFIQPRKISSAIARFRQHKSIETTTDLMEAVDHLTPKLKKHKFLAQLFQAIRIEVNDEMSALKQLLEQAAKCIKPGGRLVVISYHSLEDRMVKNFMKRGSITGEITKDFFGNILKPFKEITRHPIIPEPEEIELNNRARSAKLRIAEKNG
jgi:16S rRNA (cytosine1402-N4)-methyltransferase